jgi:hypothetical protein
VTLGGDSTAPAGGTPVGAERGRAVGPGG